MEPLIRATNLTKRYDGFALEDVSLVVEPGFVVGLIGPNGAGKTTLLKSILGIVEPDAGSIRLFGEHLDSANAPALKQRIGVVFDTCPFLTTMRVRDVARLGGTSFDAWDAPFFDDLCKRFGLDGKKHAKDLSRGMGMKLSLAFALAHHPELLILDEATAGLDPLARDEMLDLLRTFMEDERHGILIATHITTDLEKIADVIACIDGGRILFTAERDVICDAAGIAHCRTAELKAIADSAFASQNASLKMMRRNLGTDVLVPDRLAFAQAFPDISVERVSIEDYMALTLKGESL